MKKKSEKKLALRKVTVATLSKNDQRYIQGGIPVPTSPIICRLPPRTKICEFGY
jgi:hypothetical protein